jgi:predicted enzyme related to lactoylglutathione lyase
VQDVDEVHAFLCDRGVDVSEMQQFPGGRFYFFTDPDHNGWSVHQPLG